MSLTDAEKVHLERLEKMLTSVVGVAVGVATIRWAVAKIQAGSLLKTACEEVGDSLDEQADAYVEKYLSSSMAWALSLKDKLDAALAAWRKAGGEKTT